MDSKYSVSSLPYRWWAWRFFVAKNQMTIWDEKNRREGYGLIPAWRWTSVSIVTLAKRTNGILCSWKPCNEKAISNICWMFFCIAQLRKRGLWLLKLMDEEEVAEFTKPVEETKPEVVETVPEITEPAPEEKPKSTNMLPAILTLIVLPVVVDSSYLRESRKRRRHRKRQSLIRMLVMWTMTRTMGTIRSLRTMMQMAPSMKMIMNLCKQDGLDAWGSLRVAFT